MTTFVCVILVAEVIKFCITTFNLSAVEYPRQEAPVEAGRDVLALIITGGVIVWALSLLGIL